MGVTIPQISVRLGLSTRQVHGILDEYLGVSKVSTRWVSMLLAPTQKLNRSVTCRQLRELLARYGDEFWQQIITTDETLIHISILRSKSQSKGWRKPEEGRPLKARAVPSMLTVF
ncbi:hypothetical protein Trydic_g7863 [Trypoxylus dichotomus]